MFGIVGSAYMDALDLFPAAGIRFVPVAHEQAACHAADGLARVTGIPIHESRVLVGEFLDEAGIETIPITDSLADMAIEAFEATLTTPAAPFDLDSGDRS